MIIEKQDIDETRILIVDGIPQSTYPPSQGGYWQHMIPDEKVNLALILGLGAGTIPRLLLEKNPQCQITAVDNSKETIEFAKKHFKLKEIKMKIIIADAFDFITRCPLRFDYIAVDMWNGYWFPFTTLMPPFIDHCKALLNEGGWLYINTPNLDYFALKNMKEGLRDDIGMNIIYRWKK